MVDLARQPSVVLWSLLFCGPYIYMDIRATTIAKAANVQGMTGSPIRPADSMVPPRQRCHEEEADSILIDSYREAHLNTCKSHITSSRIVSSRKPKQHDSKTKKANKLKSSKKLRKKAKKDKLRRAAKSRKKKLYNVGY